MTPAITCVRKAKVDHHVHKYQHNQSVKEYGSEAAAMLEVDQKRVFKTLVVELDGGELAVSLVAVFNQLSLRRCAAVLGAKSARLAEPKAVQRSTGYVLGGVSPLGQKRKLRTIIDQSALEHSTIFVSAGRRGVELELSARDLARVVGAGFEKIVQ